MATDKTEWLSRGEFASRMKVSASMVTRYVARGLASRTDKKIEWPSGRAWVKDNVVPERSGNFYQRKLAAETGKPASRAAAAAAVPPGYLPADATAVELLQRLHGPGMVTLCKVTAALKLSPAVRTAAVHVMCSWLASVAGDELLAACEPVPVDYSGLGRVKLTAAEDAEADALSETIDKLLGFSSEAGDV